MFERHNRVIPIFALATAGSLWGTGFFFGKIALSEMPVATKVLFRLLFACAGLLPFLFFDRPRFAGAEWGWVLAAAVFGVPVQFLVQFKGLSLTTVSHASLMVGTLPILLAIAAVVFSEERLHFGGWVALVASTVGAGLIALSGKSVTGTDHASVRGDFGMLYPVRCHEFRSGCNGPLMLIDSVGCDSSKVCVDEIPHLHSVFTIHYWQSGCCAKHYRSPHV
jgi:drug/metabolite transporter (DMT)-like permease